MCAGERKRGIGLSVLRGLAGLLVVVLVAGCEADDRSWTPVLEATPPSFLEREVETALDEVRRARSDVRAAPEMAESLLSGAQERLEHLSGVYLPLYRAKVAVANAYREVALGETDAALTNVEDARESVVSVNRATEGALEPELQQIVEPLADARLALEGGSEASAYLERAAETLEDLLTRAGLLR